MNIWHQILTTAIHCPSPHNVQPWRVKIINETEAELLIDSTRTLPQEDTTGSFIILTMGMFLEALGILSAQNGFKLSYDLFHPPAWYAPKILETTEPTLLPFAKLMLSPAADQAEIFYPPELFFKRRTSRLSLSNDLVPENARQSLKLLASEWQQTFEVTTVPNQIERLLQINTAAMFADMNAPGYHNEIVEWFRFSDKESEAKLDGLDYRCMNTPRLTFWMAARLSWLMKKPLVSPVLAQNYRSQLGQIPTIGILSGGFWEPSDAIKTGRFLMRFWLETARNNLYIHPFGNLVTNLKAADAVKTETGISDIWLIFKIGYSAEPPKSHRLPLERILID